MTEPFTVVGVGDMSGDVFGNGMLHSEQTRLVAAFDHRHVFLDPTPDAAASFAERQRLFELPGSSWDDYDRTLDLARRRRVAAKREEHRPLARGRAPRSASSRGPLTPTEVMRAILSAPVDLLWNGGIGTYVQAVRRDRRGRRRPRRTTRSASTGSELRAHVVGEGGNLGFTQRGRIEYAPAGGRINTDFIDNSGGVDCSDHEVNLKILLGIAEARGDLTRKQRDDLLARSPRTSCGTSSTTTTSRRRSCRRRRPSPRRGSATTRT